MTKQKTKQNLQTALSMELTAMHQYQLHACVLDDRGMDLLAAKMREEMLEELGHSEAFLVRLLSLKGEPRVEHAKLPERAETLREMVANPPTPEYSATTSRMLASSNRKTVSLVHAERTKPNIAILL